MHDDGAGGSASAARMTQAEYFAERPTEVDDAALRDEIRRIVGGMAAKGKLRDAPDIDDIVQDVWLRFWRSPQFSRLTRSDAGFERERALYVAAIARNLVANERDRRLRRPDLFRMSTFGDVADPKDPQLSPSETAATRSALRRWLAGLTTRKRLLLDELTEKKGGEQSRQAMSTVRRVRIFRLVARLLGTVEDR